MALKFQYANDQPYQLDAINAIADLFEDQQFRTSQFTAGDTAQMMIDQQHATYKNSTLGIGFANDLRVSERRLADGLHTIQERLRMAACVISRWRWRPAQVRLMCTSAQSMSCISVMD